MTGLIVGAVIISFSSIMVVLADVPPDVAAFYRLLGGGIGLFAILAHQSKLALVTRSVLKWGMIAAVFFAFDFFCWHRSIGSIGPGLATMLANFQVIFLALGSLFFFKEKMPRHFYAAIPLALAGLYLMVGVGWDGFTADYRLGVFFGLFAAVFYALYMMSLKYSLNRSGADPLAMAAALAVLASLLLAAMALAQGESFAVHGVKSVLALATLALVCHAGGWFLITRSMTTVKGGLVGLILLLQPTLAFVWDILFFGKPVNGVELAGVGLALLGIYIGTLKKGQTPLKR